VDASGAPDWRAFDAAVGDVARGVQAGTTVAIETTVPVGTTRNRVAPRMPAGVHVAFSPERVSSGRVLRDLATYPKLVGGLDADGEARAVELYRSFITEADVWAMGSAEAAELTKLAETTYRDVNIAFANELARHADGLGLDVQRVIDAANSQPYSHIHRPGIAVGGHCIPVYPRLYLWNDPDATVVRAAREANAAMPSYTVGLAVGAAGGDLTGRHVVVLGAAYRGGVKETAFSGVFATVEALRAAGADVAVHDPLYSADELARFGFAAHTLGDPADVVVVQADHAEYRELSAGDFPGVQVVVDGRNLLQRERFEGVRFLVVGRAEQVA
jgi:nucleotide sugar dehydrogenase